MNPEDTGWTEKHQRNSEPDFYGKWIDAMVEVPKYQAYVGSEQFAHIIVCVNGNVGQGMYCNGKWEFMGIKNVNISHWMPLPDPPK